MAGDVHRLHGSKISYFTGKLETYLRYKEIPFEFVAARPERIRRQAGAAQIPALELADGRWLTDTTPIIAWLETEYPDPPVIPGDPAQAFLCWLIEDYADEWLWRPAMHYRWSYDADKHLLSRKIASELMADVPLPRALKRLLVRRRQRRIFVSGDGIDDRTCRHAEGSYLRCLELLSAILEMRLYLMGQRPTLADIGLMGPMLRHFSHDPTPSAIMQEAAPAVWEWVARTWRAKGSQLASSELVTGIPDDLHGLLTEIGETHLEYLAANAQAWQARRGSFRVTIQGTEYQRVPTSRYRVWCLEQLRERFSALEESAEATVGRVLKDTSCWDPLWRAEGLASGHDPDRRAPFAGGLEVLTAGRRN